MRCKVHITPLSKALSDSLMKGAVISETIVCIGCWGVSVLELNETNWENCATAFVANTSLRVTWFYLQRRENTYLETWAQLFFLTVEFCLLRECGKRNKKTTFKKQRFCFGIISITFFFFHKICLKNNVSLHIKSLERVEHLLCRNNSGSQSKKGKKAFLCYKNEHFLWLKWFIFSRAWGIS